METVDSGYRDTEQNVARENFTHSARVSRALCQGVFKILNKIHKKPLARVLPNRTAIN